MEIRFPDRADSLLHAQVNLGAGVSVISDVLDPAAWRKISVRAWTPDARTLLAVLIGDRSVRDIERRLQAFRGTSNWQAPETDPGLDVHMEIGGVDRSTAVPWQRVIAVDLLDRWLPIAVPQQWFDAERAFSRGRAALTLPDGPARSDVLGEALGLARGASAAIVTTLADAANGVTARFARAVSTLRDGFRVLAEAAPGDEQITAVIEAADAVLAEPIRPARPVHPPQTPVIQNDSPGHRQARWSPIDPRQVPPRLLTFSGRPEQGEIRLKRVDGERVDVEVPALLGRSGHLLVRIVEQSTGLVLAEQKLEPVLDADGDVLHFRATCCIPDGDLDKFRADVFDALLFQPVVVDDTDSGLLAVRSAVSTLLGRRFARAAQEDAERSDPAGYDAGAGEQSPLIAELVAVA